MSQLDFEYVKFYGIDRMEPEFDPSIRNYTIYRRAGTDFSFQAMMNRPPPFSGYTLEYSVLANDRRDYWEVGYAYGINCPVGRTTLSISCDKSKRNLDPTAKTVYLVFEIITEAMSDEAKAACTHQRTRTREGECWGGGSGSCQVEMENLCCDCGVTLSKWYDHRN